MTTVPDPEDLTARARIRDAAMRHIGEHGFERATIRGIAETAGVSLGLVRHHFGSKQALREACDEHLMKMIRRLNRQAADDPYGAGLNPAAVMGPYQPYLARALTEGWAAPLFDEMVDLGEGWIVEADKSRPDPPDVDARSRSTMIAAMALSATVLRQHVERGLGVDLTSPEGQVKLMRVLVDLYSHPLLSLEEAAEARKALDRGATA
ncbi:TetR/AcrR family transcriptional regulator [Nonomuraea jabiensis]|uniref:AcrR family transcriptional regulator n=1 Tax=Nonomuraea jabiensis TaxID=882448 RepID=A0A7W9GER0_9ACTN|nr:TetR family transcriptional regulator [Nonomuraea jabiensis]MBB5782480.1 AcrR family transcriptional regulator [Nonomuraea jabiensis]